MYNCTLYGLILPFYMFQYFTGDIILENVYVLIKIHIFEFLGDPTLPSFVYLQEAPIHGTLFIKETSWPATRKKKRRKPGDPLLIFHLWRILQRCGRNWVYFSLWSQDVLASVNQHSQYLIIMNMLIHFYSNSFPPVNACVIFYSSIFNMISIRSVLFQEILHC